jgi:cation diffusion facilitator CzcD-associated flavoprotein CzcO
MRLRYRRSVTMTDVAELVRPAPAGEVEHFDVLIVGAGISGVGAAYHLQQQTPWASYVALEAMDHFGGTWWQHKYPGVRSDSDLYTFGYRFKPWTSAPIASGEEILKYMREVIEENDLARRIRYRHRIETAVWSSESKTWTIEGTRARTSRSKSRRTSFGCARGTTATARGICPSGRGRRTSRAG